MKPLKRHYIETGEPASVTVILAGCGGTGSFAALHLARIAYEARRAGVKLNMIFVDPDTVEAKNIGRQNFCEAEIGLPKAHALASRYNLAFGLGIQDLQVGIGESKAIQNWRKNQWNSLCLVIGCVDSPAARVEIAESIKEASWGGQRNIWWLDSGNDEHGGQILLGNQAERVIDPSLGCVALPWPSLQEPGIVTSSPAPAASDGLSCAELLALNVQSLMINQAMAGWIGVYASRLLLSRDLDIYQTWVDLRSGTARSEAVTSEVEAVIKASAAAADFDPLAVVAVGMCPNCGEPIFEGRDTIAEEVGEDDIVFCPECNWRQYFDEWEAQQRETEGEARAAMTAGVRARRPARAIGLVEDVVNV